MADRATQAMEAVIEAPHYVDGLHDFARLTRHMNGPTRALLLHVAELGREKRAVEGGLCMLCPRPAKTKLQLCLKCSRKRAKLRRKGEPA